MFDSHSIMNYNKSGHKPECRHTYPRHTNRQTKREKPVQKAWQVSAGQKSWPKKENNNRTCTRQPLPGPQHQNAQKTQLWQPETDEKPTSRESSWCIHHIRRLHFWTTELSNNREPASEYITCLKQMQQDFDLDYDIKSALCQLSEVLAAKNSLLMRKHSGISGTAFQHVRNLSRQILEGCWNLEKDLIETHSLEKSITCRSPLPK